MTKNKVMFMKIKFIQEKKFERKYDFEILYIVSVDDFYTIAA